MTGRVWVRRTGGFAGRAVEGTLDLGREGAIADEARTLVARVDPLLIAEMQPSQRGADRFTYEFDLDGVRRVVTEERLTEDLRRLADLVLSLPEA